MFWKIYSSFLKASDPYWRWLTRNGYLIGCICWAMLALLAFVKCEDGSFVGPLCLGMCTLVGHIGHIRSRRGRRD